MTILYKDDRIVCDDDGITIQSYFFPHGGAKRIAWSDIKALDEFPMTRWYEGKFRIWGSGNFRHWFNFDPQRPRKDVGFVIDKGRFVRPVVTPANPDRFRDALAKKQILVRRA